MTVCVPACFVRDVFADGNPRSQRHGGRRRTRISGDLLTSRGGSSGKPPPAGGGLRRGFLSALGLSALGPIDGHPLGHRLLLFGRHRTALPRRLVGKDGVITVEEARTLETSLEVVEGMQFDRGYLSPCFVTDAERMEVVLENPRGSRCPLPASWSAKSTVGSSASETIQQLEEESRDMARSNYDAAVLTTVVGWFYREGYRQQRPVDFGDNDKRICEVAEAVQVCP